MQPLDVELWWWWPAVLSTSVLAVVAFSTILPLAVLQSTGAKDQKGLQVAPDEDEDSAGDCAGRKPRVEEPVGRLEEEPWCPKMEIKHWQQAGQFVGCPWNFDDCSSLEDALDRIWRKPLCADLSTAFDALRKRVKDVRIAKVSVTMPNALHFAAVYTLNTGAELFGGAPTEHAVGLDLGIAAEEEDSSTRTGLRNRKAPGSPSKRTAFDEAPDIPLPCLLPFYRIHDGFGVLLSTKHLPLVLGSPGDSVNGSCFYVYPARGLEPVGSAGKPYLLKFARVDKNCTACADFRLQQPTVVYVEKFGEEIEDDELTMPFIADTVSNIAGQRVVPPVYMGGPSPYSNACNASAA